jgi:transposase
LVAQSVARDDPDPKALACYGLIVRTWDDGGRKREETVLRCVDGRPLSASTTQFLTWCCARLAAQGTTALLLVWDNASWHVSRAVRAWIRTHNQQVKVTGLGVRLLRCQLPSKSPWLNPIEPKWVHGKRKVAEPARLLTSHELADRMHAALGCTREPYLSLPDHAA